jgi:hypothetical protein
MNTQDVTIIGMLFALGASLLALYKLRKLEAKHRIA